MWVFLMEKTVGQKSGATVPLTVGYIKDVFESRLLFLFPNKNPLTLLAELVETGPLGQLTVG
jgi:hypothetical protein